MTDLQLTRRLILVMRPGDVWGDEIFLDCVQEIPELPWATALESIPAKELQDWWTEDDKLKLLERLP